jgi:CTP:molybdopterin cytidylyltransferase MocA
VAGRLDIGIILAAGASSRMGTPKALLRAGREHFLARLARTLRAGGCGAVLAVVGRHAAEIAAELPEDLLLVRNPAWERGQLSSAQAGLRAALALRPARVVIHPVDQPLIRPADVRAVLGEARGLKLVIAAHRGEPGHPVAMTAALATRIAADRQGPTLRDALQRHARSEARVRGSRGCVVGANTPGELEALLGG